MFQKEKYLRNFLNEFQFSSKFRFEWFIMAMNIFWTHPHVKFILHLINRQQIIYSKSNVNQLVSKINIFQVDTDKSNGIIFENIEEMDKTDKANRSFEIKCYQLFRQ